MNYTEIRQEASNRRNVLLKECGVFWAFSNEQFAEGKTPLKEGEKYASIGAGGYMPNGNVEKLQSGLKEISKWEKKEIKASRELKNQHILYELNNHECFYTGDIEDALAVLPYDRKDVLKVYNIERQRQSDEVAQ